MSKEVTPVKFSLVLVDQKVAALGGYENANARALDFWEEVYPTGPLIALTDTFSTEAFYKVGTFPSLVRPFNREGRTSPKMLSVLDVGQV